MTALRGTGKGAGLGLLTVALVVAWGPVDAPPLGAQETVSELATECGVQSAERRSWCREVALAFRSAREGIGLLSGGGSGLPGSASTLGWRLESVPRLSLAGRLQLGRLSVPDILGEPRAPAPARSSWITATHLSAGVGVFDGFSPLPTVGGILSLDLLATGSVVLLPGAEGFDGNARSVGVGARLGILRESFSLPGVTVSAVKRWTGRLALGSVEDGDPGDAAFDLSTTTIRATAGKDLLGIGVLAGVGWDRYVGGVTIRARTTGEGGGSPAPPGTATADDFATSRTLVYGGASLNLLILQLSAEAGWAAGHDPLPDREGGGYDPGASTPFGSLAVRLTF